MKAYIHSYESLAGVDGDGLRYAVFLSGCPLRCIFCHNPDTWKTGAGQEITPEDLVKKVTRYTPYFKNGGGVTFSGGEPLLQAEFISECAPLLKAAGISYVIDTSGGVLLTDSVKRALLGAETVLLDIKFPSDEEYIRYTGVDFSKTKAVLDFLEKEGKSIVIRTVIIPGINDTEEKIREYAKLIAPYKSVKKYELLPFHTMGFFKYEALGAENRLKNTAAMPRKKCDGLQKILNELLKEQQE